MNSLGEQLAEYAHE